MKTKILFWIFASCFLTHPLWSQELLAFKARDTGQEIKSISQNLKGTPTSETETRAFGPFQYPVNQGGFQRLLPDISAIGTFSGAYFSTEPVAGTTGADPAKTGFNLQEIELAVQSVIDPYFKADIILAFGEASVELEEGYFTTLNLPKGFQIRGGKFRLPFGRQNPKHLETLDFADNTLANKYFFGPDGIKELGVEASYLLPTPFFLQLQGTFSNGDNATSFNSLRKKDFLYQGRVSTSFDTSENTSILLGSSIATGANATTVDSGQLTNIIGGDFLFKWKPASYRSLVWQTEFIYRRMNSPTSFNRDGGLYSYADYQFSKRWHAGLRYDQMGLPANSIARESRITPAITFNPTEFSRIRAQYEYDKIKGTKSAHAAFLQFEFSMGPHGAHAF